MDRDTGPPYYPQMERRPAAFEWDEEKAAANLRKHGVPFEVAPEAFRDDHRLDQVDSRRDYGEERRNSVACVDGLHLAVSYTMRGDVARIISIRRASRQERNRYADRS
jgi:uncharacterized DUF497 family protein